MMKDKQN